MKNIILIGNGFDLAHNLPTSYNHFIKSIALRTYKSESFNKLIQDIKIISKSHGNSHLKHSQAYVDIDGNDNNKYMITSGNTLLIQICREINIENWCDIETIYFKELNNRKNENVKPLHKEFQEIKNALEEYLSDLEEVDKINSFSTFLEKIPFSDKTLCLNFNYTNTFSKLYKTSNFEIINIHGELNSLENPIIFGYAADDKENKILLDKGNNEFLKNIKTYHYNRTPIESKLNQYLRSDNHLNIYIIGHSCGMADYNILNRIFKEENINKIEIFYYDNYDFYFDTLINLRRIMPFDSNFEAVTEYENSFRCPQHYDKADDKNEHKFNELLDTKMSRTLVLKKRK